MHFPENLFMTSDRVGEDLLSALLDEIRHVPKPWPQLSKAAQDEVIERLRDRIQDNVTKAVYLLASENTVTVVGDLEQITIKGDSKAVIKIGKDNESLLDFYQAQGKPVLIIVADAKKHMGNIEGIEGENDQRELALGHEYFDNDSRAA